MMYSMTIIASLLGSALGFSSTPMDMEPTPMPTPMDMKVPCSTPVTVTVTVKDTWCKTSHPHDFMGNIGGDGPINGPFTPPDVKAGAHTSPTVVYTHGASAPPAYGGHATQGGAKVLKVCLVSGAAACSPGAAALLSRPPGVDSPGSRLPDYTAFHTQAWPTSQPLVARPRSSPT